MSFLGELKKVQKDLRISLQEALQKAISNTYSEIKECTIEFTYPKYSKFGDYATNIALSLAKNLKTNPMTIAEQIVANLDLPKFVKKVQIEKPGFINIFLDSKQIIKKELEKFTKGYKLNKTNLKIIVEHTSVNPNKALHVGHLRNAVLGDTLARLLANYVEKVEIQNYIDDTGLQVADTTAALKLYGEQKNQKERFDFYCWDIYAKFHSELKQEDKELELSKLRREVLEQIEKQQGKYYKVSQEVVHRILDHHLSDLAKLNVEYNLLIHERDIIGFKLWDYAFELLKKSGKIKYYETGEFAGCWVFESEHMPAKILVRSNGTKVYTAKDIAYHLWKIGALDFDFLYGQWQGELYKNPNLIHTDPAGSKMPDKFGHADKVINVIDYRQSYPQQVVREAVEEVTGKSNLIYHLAYGVVNLSKNTAARLGIDTSDGKNVYAMSGRKGVGIKAWDLYNAVKSAVLQKVKETYKDKAETIDIDAITTAAIRYQLIRYTAARDIVFDIDEATQFVGKTGPYLQYSYVRALNILRKYTKKQEKDKAINDMKNKIAKSNVDIPKTEMPSEINDLIVLLAKHQEAMLDSALAIEPAVYAEYAFNLASAFNTFYEKVHILSEQDEAKQLFYMTIVFIFLINMQKILENLGITPVERM